MNRNLTLASAALIAFGFAACDDRTTPTATDETREDRLGDRGAQPVYAVEHLPSLGGDASQGNGIDARGNVAGSSRHPDGRTEATLWLDGTLTELGTLGGPNSNVAWPGQNRQGSLVVGIAETDEPGGETWACRFFFFSSAGNRCLGFVYENGEMTALPTWTDRSDANGFATGANARGQVVGWAENDVEDPTCNAPVTYQFRAAMWEPRRGTMTELPPLPGDSTSAATAINDRGEAVGISGDCANAVGGFSARHAVLWDHGEVSEIDDLGGAAWHTPMDINNRGEVVGFGNPSDVPGADFGIQAFYWSAGTGVDSIGVLDGMATSQALGINGRGQVVGQSAAGTVRRAFYWEGDEIIDLNDLVEDGYEGTLLSGGHINDAGVITGVALDPDSGDEVVYVATPVGKGGAR